VRGIQVIGEALVQAPLLGHYRVNVPRSGQRAARTATVSVRSSSVVFEISARVGRPSASLPVTVVRVHEESCQFASPCRHALKLDQKSRGVRKKRTVPKVPSIGEAARWVAELGGWIDQSGNGPPGATTLARGFERLALIVQGIRLAEAARRPNRRT
jgi:hypothetical protein